MSDDEQPDDVDPFSDAETLILPGGGLEEEHQWWYPDIWMIEGHSYFCAPPGNPRWAWSDDDECEDETNSSDVIDSPASKRRRT